MSNSKASAILRNFILIFVILFVSSSAYSFSLDPIPEDYEWEIERTSIKIQGPTSCWVFAAISFLESECIRKNLADEQLDLSEAYVHYYAFLEKAKRYLETMGKSRLGRFTEGGLAHDVIYLVDKYGIVREDDYQTTEAFKTELNMTSLLKQAISRQRLRIRFKHELDSAITKYHSDGYIPEDAMVQILENIKTILNEEIGVVPEEISYNGSLVTPLYFARNILDIHNNDYVHITSFENLGFQKRVKLDLFDNWLEYDQYLNLDTESLYEITRSALTMQYGLVIDCDVSDIGFHAVSGRVDKIIYPDDLDYDEIAKIRDNQFKTGITTDDHLMHIVGFDERTSPWFLLKNSWGEIPFGIIPIGTEDYRGYHHMSKIYFLLKTVSVTVHKDMLNYFPEIDF